MARYTTSVTTNWSPKKAFTYLADLRNFAEWDPGVRRVAQVQGDGPGASAEFDVTVAGVGRDLTLRYRTIEFDLPTNVLVKASSAIFTSIDRITITPEGRGCVVTYDAELLLNGVLGLANPMLGLVFNRIGDRAAAGLSKALGAE